jgi:hypothetical protein
MRTQGHLREVTTIERPVDPVEQFKQELELKRREERIAARRLQQQEAERVRRERLAAQPLRPLRLDELENRTHVPTLREAATILEERFCGVEVKDGTLRVLVQESFEDRDKVLGAARVLVAGRDVVLAAIARAKEGQALSELLPDLPVLAGGGVEQ